MTKEEIQAIEHKLKKIKTLTGKQALTMIKPILAYAKVPKEGGKITNGVESDTVIKKKKGEWFLKEQIYKDFIVAWKLYEGHRVGPIIGFKLLLEHSDYKSVVPILKGAIEREISYRKAQTSKGGFVPEWAHFKTWVKERRWEQEFPDVEEVKESIL